MNDLEATALRYRDGELYVLDQRLLPGEERWLHCTGTAQLVELIRGLAIRGAPLIGIAAALWVGHSALQGEDHDELTRTIGELRKARPTAVNLTHYLDRLQHAVDNGQSAAKIGAVAVDVFEQDVALCAAMSNHGAALLQAGDNILTHCNTGSLATAGAGTAVGVIMQAHRLGKNIHVWVDETRPLLQGARLTTWELQRAGIPHTLICDGMAAGLMAVGRVDRVVVGADRIARNGDFANKIGTFMLAVLAHHHQVPFYVVAPRTTVDTACPDGGSIPIEQRDPEEVRGVIGSYGTCLWSPPNVPVYNPAFDITPAELVTGWVLDSGVYTGSQVRDGALTGRCRNC
jgi:methylthioribose-1-phosphate isomerase